MATAKAAIRGPQTEYKLLTTGMPDALKRPQPFLPVLRRRSSQTRQSRDGKITSKPPKKRWHATNTLTLESIAGHTLRGEGHKATQPQLSTHVTNGIVQ